MGCSSFREGSKYFLNPTPRTLAGSMKIHELRTKFRFGGDLLGTIWGFGGDLFRDILQI